MLQIFVENPLSNPPEKLVARSLPGNDPASSFSSPINACFCGSDTDRLWADVTAFDRLAGGLMGGVAFSDDRWPSDAPE